MKSLIQKGFLAVTLACALGAAAQEPAPPGGLRGGFGGMQRVSGTVTAVTGDAVTVKGEDGAVYQVTTTANTRVMKGQGVTVKVADLKAGDGVMAAGNLDAPTKTLHAMFLVATDAETLKKMRENLGKTYIAGKVTAIDADNLKMTVKRADGVDQVIGFDESTSFRRGRAGRGGMMVMGGPVGATPPAGANAQADAGESITLADIKVGDQVTGQGSLKSGTFVPGQLTVSTPRAPGEGRRERPGGAPPQAAPQTTQPQ